MPYWEEVDGRLCEIRKLNVIGSTRTVTIPRWMLRNRPGQEGELFAAIWEGGDGIHIRVLSDEEAENMSQGNDSEDDDG